jgi:membrane dipeptidase
MERALPRAARGLDAVVDHLEHVCALLGDADHVSIGSDLDGGFGRELSPVDLDTIADLAALPQLLRDRGFSEADVEKIAHRNLLRLFGAWGGEIDNG